MFLAIRNEGQNANNLFKLYEATDGCCGEDTAVCQYSVVLPTANAVNNIIITNRLGVAQTITTGFPATGAANVRAAIKTALESAGYEDDTDVVSGVTSETSGTNTIYRITGDVVVVSMLHNSVTTVAATALCDRIKKCVYTYDWPGSGGTSAFVVDGVSATLASFTIAGNTAAQVQAALIALANWPTTATVNVTETATAFEIRMTDVFGKVITLGGEDLEPLNCGMGFVVAA